jgi:hypothetical protein
MLNKKVISSWLFSSILMFALSYLWHGVILNDFNKISYPKPIFFSFLGLLYLISGLLISIAYSFIPDKKNPMLRGCLIGVATGFIMFLIVFVLGTSFKGKINSLHASIDFIWQIIEQGTGGLLVGIVFNYFEKREMFFNNQ